MNVSYRVIVNNVYMALRVALSSFPDKIAKLRRASAGEYIHSGSGFYACNGFIAMNQKSMRNKKYRAS